MFIVSCVFCSCGAAASGDAGRVPAAGDAVSLLPGLMQRPGPWPPGCTDVPCTHTRAMAQGWDAAATAPGRWGRAVSEGLKVLVNGALEEHARRDVPRKRAVCGRGLLGSWLREMVSSPSFHARPGLCWLSGLAACCSHRGCVDSTNVRVCCLPAFASGGVSGTQWGRLHPRPQLVAAGTCFAALSLCLRAPAGPGSVSALTTASCRAWGARPVLTRLAHSTRVLGGRRCVWLLWPAPRPDMVGGRLMRRGAAHRWRGCGAVGALLTSILQGVSVGNKQQCPHPRPAGSRSLGGGLLGGDCPPSAGTGVLGGLPGRAAPPPAVGLLLALWGAAVTRLFGIPEL